DSVLTTVLSIVTALGIGSMLGAYFQTRFQQRTQVRQQEHDLKRQRYLCILMLMITKLDPDVGLPKIRAIRPDLKASSDIDEELATEVLNGFIYASDEVLKTLAQFIHRPDYDSFIHAAVAMRKDLWGKKTAINNEIVEIMAILPSEKKINDKSTARVGV
ncbi:MAG TPA: hypothetical protein VID27_15375, partial [Blastocatellia bacterium]